MQKTKSLRELNEDLKNRLSDIRDSIDDTLETGRKGIREYPLLAVGLAAGVGIIIGMLLGRNSKDQLSIIRDTLHLVKDEFADQIKHFLGDGQLKKARKLTVHGVRNGDWRTWVAGQIAQNAIQTLLHGLWESAPATMIKQVKGDRYQSNDGKAEFVQEPSY